tara:strand:+ start:83 stop:1036 length:954 start_codon:yes stop_codon:yes gene_type:complete
MSSINSNTYTYINIKPLNLHIHNDDNYKINNIVSSDYINKYYQKYKIKKENTHLDREYINYINKIQLQTHNYELFIKNKNNKNCKNNKFIPHPPNDIKPERRKININNQTFTISKNNDDKIVKKDNKYNIVLKNNKILGKDLIDIMSRNCRINKIISSYGCKRLYLDLENGKWIWYNKTYKFVLEIKYKILNYNNCYDYSIILKYNNTSFDIHNYLIKNKITHLDEKIKEIFIEILENIKGVRWELHKIKNLKYTKYLVCAILAPLQYYQLYLSYLQTILSNVKYHNFIQLLYYFGNININDNHLYNQIIELNNKIK